MASEVILLPNDVVARVKKVAEKSQVLKNQLIKHGFPYIGNLVFWLKFAT